MPAGSEYVAAEDTLVQVMAVLGTVFMWILFVAFVWIVLNIIACWFIFKKTGEPGWKSLIPVYSYYVLYSRVWSSVFFWVTVVLNAVVFYTNPAGAVGDSMTALQMVGAACTIASTVLYALLNYKTAKAFGKGVGFTLGLIFLRPIFLMILGFGSAQYEGPQ